MIPDDASGVLPVPDASGVVPVPAAFPAPTRRPAGRVFFLGDPLDRLDRPWDTSLRLMEAQRRRGTPVAWATVDDMMIRGRTLILHGAEVGPADLVWLRLDPSVSVAWYEALRALCHVDARIVNAPGTVLTVHDKRSALSLCPRPTWSLFSPAQVGPVAGEMRRMGVETIVLKPPSLFASKGVKFIAADDRAGLEAGFADLVGLFGYVIAEPYLGPGAGLPPVDLRVLVTATRVIGAIERVIPVGGGLHDVTKAGAFTAPQARLVTAAMEFLRDEGIFLAGLDFLGDTLTEINVSCPGAIPEINMFCGIMAEDAVLDDLAAALPG